MLAPRHPRERHLRPERGLLCPRCCAHLPHRPLFPPAFSLSELTSTHQYDGTCRGPAQPPKAGSTSSELEKALVQKGLAGKGSISRLRSGSRLPLTFPSAFASKPAVLQPLHPQLLSPDCPAVPRTGTRT